MTEMVQLLVQAGAIGICLVLLYYLYKQIHSNREEREKMQAECQSEREQIAAEHRKERQFWNSENARMTAEMIKMAGLLMGRKKDSEDV